MPEMLAQRLYIKALERIINLEERVEELESELHLMKTSGVVEVSVRNPSVMEYMKHWEGRAETAEARLAKAVEALEKLNVGEGWAAQIARTTLAELKAEEDE